MSRTMELIRPEILRMRPYRSAQFESGLVRLNANENPWPPPGDDAEPSLNRYPEPRAFALAAQLAEHYGVEDRRLLVTRGSSEGIDVVIRGFCRAGIDEVVLCPPTFGMYEAYAQVQGAVIRRIPLLRERGYALDSERILAEWSDVSRVLFICSPNNPTGNSVPSREIGALARELRDRGVVVVDAAYVEFANADPTLELLAAGDNVIVLRTLSKAMALAGARCGSLIASPEVTQALSCVLPPYSVPTPCAEAVRHCLRRENDSEWQRRIMLLKAERQRVIAGLAASQRVSRIWPSDANFVLIESPHPAEFVAAAQAAGILVRDFSWDPDLPGCIRITIGEPHENDKLLKALD